MHAITVLIGPNNEGKSNLVKALACALHILTTERGQLVSRYRFAGTSLAAPRAVFLRKPESTSFRVGPHIFDWNHDFPISLNEDARQKTEFTIEFALDADEIGRFREAVGSNLNGTLPIHIAIDQAGQCTIKVKKPGRGQKALTNKSDRITSFIGERLDFQHIPAIRTSESAEEIVSQLIASKLQEVESSQDYKNALALLEKVQKPVLEEFAASLTPTLRRFLPNLKALEFKTVDRQRALRRTTLILNDGTPTALSAKGDGVQSLAALALMRHMSEDAAGNKHNVIAIEEPEAHLHPGAAHAIHAVIKELSKRQQILITTHNPIFVQRAIIGANIVVRDGSAIPAESVSDIRKSLGVRASDNLMHASLVLLVEGETDRRVLTAILGYMSETLKASIADGVLVLEQMHGAGNVVYKASQIQEALCSVHCLLDDDMAGRKAYQDLINSAVLSGENVTITKVEGFKEAELEDLLDPSVYKEAVAAAFRVSLDVAKFRGNVKWSTRMRATFQAAGKEWDQLTESKAKTLLAGIIEKSPERAISEHRRLLIEALTRELEQRLEEINTDL